MNNKKNNVCTRRLSLCFKTEKRFSSCSYTHQYDTIQPVKMITQVRLLTWKNADDIGREKHHRIERCISH